MWRLLLAIFLALGLKMDRLETRAADLAWARFATNVADSYSDPSGSSEIALVGLVTDAYGAVYVGLNSRGQIRLDGGTINNVSNFATGVAKFYPDSGPGFVWQFYNIGLPDRSVGSLDAMSFRPPDQILVCGYAYDFWLPSASGPFTGVLSTNGVATYPGFGTNGCATGPSGAAINTDSAGNHYYSGELQDGSEFYGIPAIGGSIGYVVKAAPDGTLLWVLPFVPSAFTQIAVAPLGPKGELFVAIAFRGDLRVGARALKSSSQGIALVCRIDTEKPNGPPVFRVEPLDRTALEGEPIALSPVADGEGPLFYQWFLNGSPIANSTNRVLRIATARTLDAGDYTVTISNASGSVTSRKIKVGVNTIGPMVRPPFQTLLPGEIASFHALAPTTNNLQWLKDDEIIPGETNSFLVLSNVTVSDIASYTFILQSQMGPKKSSPGVLDIFSPSPEPHPEWNLDLPGKYLLSLGFDPEAQSFFGVSGADSPPYTYFAFEIAEDGTTAVTNLYSTNAAMIT